MKTTLAELGGNLINDAMRENTPGNIAATKLAGAVVQVAVLGDEEIKRLTEELRLLVCQRKELKVGDVVASNSNGYELRSGRSVYHLAVIVQESPLAAVSLDGDMLWISTLLPDSLSVVRRATKTELKNCLKRLT